MFGLELALIGLNIYTHHTHDACTNTNPGIYVQTTKGYSAGVYHNSDCRTTVHIGAEILSYGPFSVSAGLMHGYKKAVILPYVLPSVSAGPFRLTLIPQKKAAVHLSIEQRF